jgi:hemolysin activation/secretion protein
VDIIKGLCSVSTLLRYGFVCGSALAPLSAFADSLSTSQAISDRQAIYQQEQQRAREEQLAADTPDVRFDIQTESTNAINFPQESPCFAIERVELEGLETVPKWLRLQYLAAKGQNHCLGGQGINLLMSALQNRMIDSGFVTSRILAPEQDLTSGTLRLLILPGKVRHVSKTSESDRYLTLFNTLPSREGQLLDLRDIEQGLENLQRIPTASAEINMMPGEQPGESDIVVSWQQRKMWRLGASFDDSGTVETGRYQGGLTFYLDNPASLGDMFYLSGGHDARGSNEKGSKNYTASYSVPFGYWSVALTSSANNYHQTVSGSNLDYQYSGRSRNLTLHLNRMLHRNASHKTSVFYDVIRRNSQNYINDTEVEIQRRTTTAWKLGLQHRHYFDRFTFDGGIDYQRGTRWFGARPAPEEASGDGTALTSIVRLSASVDVPFSVFEQRFSYSSRFQRQLARVPLTSQDRFSIGGRWSVRGFDGELSLSADNGWYVRNDLSWQTPVNGQQLYLAVDYGEVGGTNSEYLIGKHLAGGAVGVKGYINPLNLSYDAFAGIPLSKPKGFDTSSVALGFSLFWEY